MRSIVTLLLALVLLTISARAVVADEPLTLMGSIAPWSYPQSKMAGAETSDAATVDGDGKRTVQSFVCKTTMITEDPVEKVLAFYKAKLAPVVDADAQSKADLKDGRSVVISDDSEGRPFALHTILINTKTSSTTLIISRGRDESQTYIVWKKYVRL